VSAADQPKPANPTQRGVFRTADLPPEERNAAWNAIAGPFFDHVVPLEDKAMDGEIRADLLGDWATCRIRFNPHSYARRRARSADDGLDYYFIQLYCRGALHGECAGRSVSLRPGDILILDVREALTLRASAGEIITLIIPHADIDRLPADLHGQVLLRERDSTRQLAARFESLEARLSETGADAAQALQSSIRSVLIAAIDDALNEVDPPPRRRSSRAVPEPACKEVGAAPTSLQAIQTTLLGWSKRDD